MTMNLQPDDHFIDLKEVKQRTSLSVATIYRRMRDGTFPRCIAIGPNTSRWLESEIQAWMLDKIKNSRFGVA